jgi:hypothetical protein
MEEGSTVSFLSTPDSLPNLAAPPRCEYQSVITVEIYAAERLCSRFETEHGSGHKSMQ